MSRVLVALLVLLAGLAPAVQPAAAQVPSCLSCDADVASDGGGGYQVVGSVSDKVPGRDRATPGGSGSTATEWVELNEYMTPACGGNGLHGADELCMAAVSTCGQGQVRWWIWQQEVRATRNPDGTVTRAEGEWERLPGTSCLGNDDPGVPDYGRAISLVQTGFQNLPLPRADVEVAPAPTSLVHVPTAFYAGGAQTFSQPVTPVPGITVTVTAEPTSWIWRWGDGGSNTFTTPGEPRRPVVSHPYALAQDFSAYVEVSWKGSFTIAGSSEVLDIPTPAIVTSDPVTVQVREARTQLVDQS